MISLGQNVRVASGPHEGRSGTVVQLRDVVLGYSEPEQYAIVEYGVDGGGKDAVSVPVRRLERK